MNNATQGSLDCTSTNCEFINTAAVCINHIILESMPAKTLKKKCLWQMSQKGLNRLLKLCNNE
jgi:hypothetical protein